MKKRSIAFVLIIILLLGGCAVRTGEEPIDIATEPETEMAQSGEFSFADLENLEFLFASGAGSWGTLLYVKNDGSFAGTYTDYDAVTAADYQNGMITLSEFNGQFTKPEKVNDYTYSVKIDEINYKEEPGKEEIVDDVLYCYSGAHGLNDAENILIYLPGAPLAELPEDFRSWIGYSDLSKTEERELPFYALNNEKEQFGFTSRNIIESLQQIIASAEEDAALLEDSIINDDLTQAGLNEKSYEIYNTWDMAMNNVCYFLNWSKNADTMERLTKEQSEWRDKKEKAVSDAAAEFEGGSMSAMAANLKAAEMTKERVYELMKLFDKEGE